MRCGVSVVVSNKDGSGVGRVKVCIRAMDRCRRRCRRRLLWRRSDDMREGVSVEGKGQETRRMNGEGGT